MEICLKLMDIILVEMQRFSITELPFSIRLNGLLEVNHYVNTLRIYPGSAFYGIEEVTGNTPFVDTLNYAKLSFLRELGNTDDV